ASRAKALRSNALIASRSVRGTCGKSLVAYTSPWNIGGGSILLRMPSKPEAIAAAYARYGFTSAPGIRDSMRKDLPCPTARKPAVRLSKLHAKLVGAHEPD